MNKILSILLITLLGATTAFAQWKPAGNRIKTKWAKNVDPSNVLPEYPRPIMERKDWKNLNGLWNYSIKGIDEAKAEKADGQILVPFPVESSLSGVQKRVSEKEVVWYDTEFEVSSDWKGQDILLHFGAVDWKAEVWVNDIKVGAHTGGYTSFSFDITPFLQFSGKEKLTVRVWDGTNTGDQPRGKQVNKPEGIWYTPVTGIWQTVWLEPVPAKHIENLRVTPDIDRNLLQVEANVAGTAYGDVVEVQALDKGTVVATAKVVAGETAELYIKSPKLWSPESPFLYDLKVSLISEGKKTDAVDSYFAMRKISKKRDDKGIVRLQLNNKDYFQFGPLDQGWWPDGLYTAPTDEALAFDIKKTKDMGFNMIRKHTKVEPARWYTHCDKLGILVWQDMPTGGGFQRWENRRYFHGEELQRSAESEKNFRKEWKEIMDQCYSYPSIVVWVPFNEAWGQFKTKEIVEWTTNYDPSRLIDGASGGNHFAASDMLDLHSYPAPELFLYDGQRATVLGEYGGIGMVEKGHIWDEEKNWGYVQFKNKKQVTDEYVKYAKILKGLVKAGFSAAVYTQTTDVEGEVNGLLTYDREVIKVDEAKVRAINQEVIHSLDK